MSDHQEHPRVAKLRQDLADGRVDRREFVRLAALLGVAAPAAYAMGGLASPPASAAGLPFASDDPKARSGGVLKVAMQVQKMDDPATYAWTEMSNQTRHVAEYLTMTGPDNVTRPMLAERWEASEDLKSWTFYIRKNVRWHNGDELTAEHVAWNVRRWLDTTLGSANIGLSTFAAMLEETGEVDAAGKPQRRAMAGGVEVVDQHTLRLNLARAVLSVPEDFYNYPTAILHPTFKPPFSGDPVGTGPFRLAELKVGERCILKRVETTSDGKDFTYWGGRVYLDEIHYYNFDEDNQLAALASGDVDTLYEFGIEQLELAKALPGRILTAETAQTLCCRMQVDQEPFDDPRVRQAIVKAVDNRAIQRLVYPEGASPGENHHVAPIHPEYHKLAPVSRDVAGARKLLADAGYADGLSVTITVGNTDGPWHQTVAEAMRDQLKDVGIELKLSVLPPSKFWEVWDKVAFGATPWTHRPLGTMVLSLGYRSATPWNESHFASPAFDAALDAAEATLDVGERRAKMRAVEKILQEACVMVQPLWRPVYTMAADGVHGLAAHPTQYHQFNKVWKG